MRFSFSKSLMLTLFLTVMILVVSCHGSRRRRAIPVYRVPTTENKGNNSHKDDNDEYFKTFWKKQNGGLCPFGQVLQRNNTVCCKIAVCGPDFEIEECRTDGTEDRCSQCKDGYLQFHNISSLNMDEAKCFPEVILHKECPIGDYRAARKIMHNFRLPCECVLEWCYVEDSVGSCDLRKGCNPGFQLNETGTCEPCPWHSFKNVYGCEPCTINRTLLWQGKPGAAFVIPKLRTTTLAEVEKVTTDGKPAVLSPTKTDTPPHGKNGLDTVYIILLAIIAAALVGLMLVGIYFCYKKKMSSRSVAAPPTPSADNAPLLSMLNENTLPIYLPNDNTNVNFLPNNHINGHVRNGFTGNANAHSSINEDHRIGVVGNGNLRRYQNPQNGISHGSIPNGDVRIGNGIQPGLSNRLDIVNEEFSPDENQEESVKVISKKQTRNPPLQQIPSLNRAVENGNGIGEDLEETFPDESLIVQYDGTVGKLDAGRNSEGAHKLINPKEKSKRKGNTTVSFHNNTFTNSKIIFKQRNPSYLNSFSGTFVADSSLNTEDSTSLSSDPTFKQSGRGVGFQNNEENENIEFDPERNYRHCRPELDGSSNVTSPENNARESELDPENAHDARGADMVGDGSKVERGVEQVDKEMQENSRAPPTVVKDVPLQRERPVVRVAPLPRQNSTNLQHVSGNVSRLLDDDSASSMGSMGSMSYALMHRNPDLDNGYMNEDVANTNDFSEIDGNENSGLQSVIYDDAQLNRGCASVIIEEEGLVSRNEAESNERRAVQANDNEHSVTNRDVNGTGMVNCVPPMSQRVGPEGDSITYMPETDRFITRPDLQQTGRKILANETDQNETSEKQTDNSSTNAKAVDFDEDLTEYKNRIKRTENYANDTDLKKPTGEDDAKGNEREISTSDINESFELNSNDRENEFNVENILYAEERDTDGEKNENEASEKDGSESFEINREDFKLPVTTRTIDSEGDSVCDINDNANTSKSFEIDANDIKEVEGASKASMNDVSIEANSQSDKSNLESQKGYSDLVIESNAENDRVLVTSSEDSSFEINSAEVRNLALNEERDCGHASGVNNVTNKDLSTEVRHFAGDSQYSSVTSSDKLSDSDSDRDSESESSKSENSEK